MEGNYCTFQGNVYLKYGDAIPYEIGMINIGFDWRIESTLDFVVNNHKILLEKEYWIKLPMYTSDGKLVNYRTLKIVKDDDKFVCKGIVVDEN